MSAKAAAADLAEAYQRACGGHMYQGGHLIAGCDPHAVAGDADEATFVFIGPDGELMRATVRKDQP